MVTDMVKVRKLTRDLVANFPRLAARSRVANKWDIGNSVRFRALLAVQNWTESDKSLTKECKNVQKRAKRRQKSAVFATGFIKTCQVAQLVSSSDKPIAAPLEIRGRGIVLDERRFQERVGSPQGSTASSRGRKPTVKPNIRFQAPKGAEQGLRVRLGLVNPSGVGHPPVAVFHGLPPTATHRSAVRACGWQSARPSPDRKGARQSDG